MRCVHAVRRSSYARLRRRVRRGMISYPVPATAICGEYRARGTAHELVPLTRRAKQRRASPRRAASSCADHPCPKDPSQMDIATFRTVLQEVLREELGVGEARIQPRFQGGELI